MRDNKMQTYYTQKGTVLFISLIMLIILTVMGLTSMQGSIDQEKMTAAVRDSRVALEGAEAALHKIEKTVIESMATTGGFDNSGCLYGIGAAPKQINGVWPANFWKDGRTCIAEGINVRSQEADGSDGSLAEAPRYFAELSGKLTNDDATNIMIFNYNNNAGAGEVTGIRVVVSSAGSTETSRKYLSSYYGKRF